MRNIVNVVLVIFIVVMRMRMEFVLFKTLILMRWGILSVKSSYIHYNLSQWWCGWMDGWKPSCWWDEECCQCNPLNFHHNLSQLWWGWINVCLLSKTFMLMRWGILSVRSNIGRSMKDSASFMKISWMHIGILKIICYWAIIEFQMFSVEESFPCFTLSISGQFVHYAGLGYHWGPTEFSWRKLSLFHLEHLWAVCP